MVIFRPACLLLFFPLPPRFGLPAWGINSHGHERRDVRAKPLVLHRPAEQGEERPAQADGDDNRRSARPRAERFETRLRDLDLALSLLDTFFLCM